MNIQPPRRSSLFLLELIIAILFFSLASAVCVRLFVKSHTLEQESTNLNHAVSAAVSVAEIVRTQEAPYTLLKKQYPQGTQKDSSFEFYYDAQWNLCTQTDAHFTIVLTGRSDASFWFGTIDVIGPNGVLYNLEIKRYLTEEEP